MMLLVTISTVALVYLVFVSFPLIIAIILIVVAYQRKKKLELLKSGEPLPQKKPSFLRRLIRYMRENR